MSVDDIKTRIRNRLFNINILRSEEITEKESVQMNSTVSTTLNNRIKWINFKKRIKTFLERVPIVGNLLLWLWRLINLPHWFYRLSRHFESIVSQMDKVTSTQGKHEAAIQQVTSTQGKHEAAIQQVTSTQAKHEAAIRQLSKPVDVENTLVVEIPPYVPDHKKSTTVDENAFYLSFENVFRGTETEIYKRQSIYIPYILKASKHAKGRKYFLDLGCGRGEFLKILRKADIPAKGIEINTAEYKNLKTQNFNVELSETNPFLEGIDNNTLTGISGLQVIEHLTQDYLKKLLELAYMKITLKGIIILETVNPKCSFASSNFYLDPTHIRPYPPELLKFLLEWYGFKELKIIYSSPCPEEFRIKNAPEHNYMDYVVIGWKK